MRFVVGSGSCGIAAGADKVYQLINEQIESGNTKGSVELTGCIGTCYLEPIVDVYHNGKMKRFVKMDEQLTLELIEASKNETLFTDAKESDSSVEEQLDKQNRIVLRNCGVINPERIEDYIEKGGYKH